LDFPGYNVLETIHRSQRTVIFRARRQSDGARVVLKALAREYPEPDEQARLAFEHHVLGRLQLPGVIGAHALLEHAGRCALVLEDFPGESLARLGPTLRTEQVLDVALALARTLGEIHARGVVHKDINPGNVLFDPRTGAVKLIDFELASELRRERFEPSLRLEGSPAYVSPEQTGRINRDLDYRTDYYSLGVSLFELLTGQLPFRADDTLGWIHCHISKPAPRVRDVAPRLPSALGRIVERLLEKDPARRYQSARGLTYDLEQCRGRLHVPELDYELGTRDVSHIFHVCEDIVGRDAEVEALIQAYGRASSGQPTLVFVAGPSGIGKSSLVRELHKHIVQQRGAFAAGKFDQLERNTPHAALVQALTRVCKQLLGEPDEQLGEWRRLLLGALGANARLMTELVPRLQSILGPQPEPLELAAKDAELRFRSAVAGFVRALAREGHPLALFLDDLQWMDPSTPQLLLDLFAGEAPCHLLLIGAYRDDEVRPGHSLRQLLVDLRERAPNAVRELRLSALGADAVTRVVAATLSSDAATVSPLTGILLEKTEGNPHFIGELLEELYRQNAFHYLPDEGRWSFDSQAIERARLGSDFADTIARRLVDLPGDALQLLQIAACIGNRFELGLLARASERPLPEVISALALAVEQRLIVAEGSEHSPLQSRLAHGTTLPANVTLRFQHDRVQAAAYALLDAAQRAALHLEIGRLLLARSADGERGERLLEIVNHLNMGCEHLSSNEERTRLAVLNTRAGRRAKRSAAHMIAASYFESAALLLGDEEPPIQTPSLAPDSSVGLAAPDRLNRFDLQRERLECLFAAGEIDRAGALADELWPLAPTPLARAAICDVQAGVLEHRGDARGSLEPIRRGLGLLGLGLPVEPTQIAAAIGQGVGRLRDHLARVPTAELVSLPLLSEPERLMQMRLLARAIPATVAVDRQLFILLELTMFDISLSFGVCAPSCKNFVDLGVVLGPMLGDSERAYALGPAGLALLDRLHAASYRGAAEFVFGGFVSHWRAPLSEGMAYYRAALRHCEEAGDIQHASYACVHTVLRALALALPLPECKAELQTALARLARLHAANQGALLTALERDIDELMSGPSPTPSAHDPGESNIAWRYTLAQVRALVCLMLDDSSGAERWSLIVEGVLDNVAALASLPEHHMVAGLARCQRLTDVADDARAELEAKIQVHRAKLALWAGHCPSNYRHMHLLLCAEHERARGAPLADWLELYGESVRAAGEGFIQHRALARELEGRAWLAQGQLLIARTFLREAYHLYRQWGARHKLTRLAERYPAWFGEQEPSAALSLRPSALAQSAVNDSLDLSSIIKANGAISSEVKSDALFRRLMSILIESAGAQRGFLILARSGALEIVAGVSVDGTPDQQLPLGLEQSRELCADVVRYVARCRESLVVGDAPAAGDYTRDPYVVRTGVKSMLGVPILQQGTLLGVLYADNHVTRHAFGQARIDLLELIAGQAAISISNAQLYEQLEERVAERTRSLAEKTRQIEAMFGALKQGICLVDADLRVQPQYSRHLSTLLGTTEIAGKSCLELLFAGSDVAPAALHQMELALRVCFGSSTLSASVNAGHLVREFKRLLSSGEVVCYELEWSFVEDERGDVETVLLALRDVTQLRKWQADAEQGAREVRMLTEILERGIEEFRQLVDSSSELLRQSRGLLVGVPASPQAALGALFRNMHTIKGNASVLGYGYLVEAAHRAENTYAELRGSPRLEWDRERLRRGLDEVDAQLDEYQQICERKLRGVATAGAHDGELAAQLREIERLTCDVDLDPALIVARVRELSRRPFVRSLERLLAETARGLEPAARASGKPMPEVRWHGPDARVGDAWSRALGHVFMHALRNSLDHGIEAVPERLARGKPPQGSVVVQLELGTSGAQLSLRDDGRGLHLAALARHATSDADDQQVADTIFRPGVSTAQDLTEYSGRGVGMDAIRGFVRELGGDVRLELGPSESPGHRRFALIVSLPHGALLEAPDAEREPTSALRSAS
jgi:predicted ATPase/GAF domain-containing protein/HPt (histidine-containing phosphotransfer) domain-containing protein